MNNKKIAKRTIISPLALVEHLSIAIACDMGNVRSSLFKEPRFYIAGDICASRFVNKESTSVYA